jgi:hydroxymethylglutaryl-CoA synthase
LITQVHRAARTQADYRDQVLAKMQLGQKPMEELGNLYTGALPAWLAAGLEEAAADGRLRSGDELLLIGYGSGDAAEAIPIHLVDGWQRAAQQMGLSDSMAQAIDLTEAQYIALREGNPMTELDYVPQAEFIVDHIGSMNEDDFQDSGIEYYRFVR